MKSFLFPSCLSYSVFSSSSSQNKYSSFSISNLFKQVFNRKTMFVVLPIFFNTICSAQYSYQNANSILLNQSFTKNNGSVEASFEFNHFGLTGMYNLSPKVFLHANLKLNVMQQKADKFFGDLLGGKIIMLHNNDIGFGGGFGLQHIGSIGKLHMQLVFGYDYEKQRYKFDDVLTDANSYSVDSISHQRTALYKISSNLNFINISKKYNVSYLLRVSYCQFTKFQYNHVDATVRSSGFAIAEPAVELDFKLLKNRNLFITSQCGLSLPLSNFAYAYKADLPFEATTETSDYLLDFILKAGIKYTFINH